MIEGIISTNLTIAASSVTCSAATVSMRPVGDPDSESFPDSDFGEFEEAAL